MFNELKMINENKIVSFMFKQNMYAIWYWANCGSSWDYSNDMQTWATPLNLDVDCIGFLTFRNKQLTKIFHDKIVIRSYAIPY